MEVTRKHLVGLEMALDSWNDGGPSVQFAAHLHDLIAQAEASSEAEPALFVAPDSLADLDRIGMYATRLSNPVQRVGVYVRQGPVMPDKEAE